MSGTSLDVLHTEGLPPLPKYNVEKIMARRDLLIAAGQPFLGIKPEGDQYKKLCLALTEALPGRFYSGTIEQSLLDVVGVELTAAVLNSVCWRLAANLQRLREFTPVPAWTRQIQPEWMPLHIAEVVKKRRRDGLIRANVTCRVLAGSAASKTLRVSWSHGLCAGLAYDFGFSKPYKSYPFVDVLQLTSMCFFGYFEPELCLEGPMFNKMRISTSQRRRNTLLAQMRTLQHELYDCDKQLPCHLCHLGLDQCAKATHPRTHVLLRCESCGHESWHDPQTMSLGKCIDCLMN